MGLTLPVRVGFTPVTRGGERRDLCLVFLVPDLDILSETEVAQYLNQQADSKTHFQWVPILLPVLLGVALAGATARELPLLASNKFNTASCLNKSVRI
jgi:hypothetical protein